MSRIAITDQVGIAVDSPGVPDRVLTDDKANDHLRPGSVDLQPIADPKEAFALFRDVADAIVNVAEKARVVSKNEPEIQVSIRERVVLVTAVVDEAD